MFPFARPSGSFMQEKSLAMARYTDATCSKTQLVSNHTSTLSTFRLLLRISLYAKSALPQIYLGMGALGAGLVTLGIPLVLEALVDGPLATGDTSQIWWAATDVLGLGTLEAIFIALRRCPVSADPWHPR